MSLGGQMLAQRRLDHLGVGRAAERAARDADDPALRRQLVVALAVEQRRQQLAPREVAGAAEHHEVEHVHPMI